MIVRLDPTKDADTIRQLGIEDDPEPEALVLSAGEGLSPHRVAIRVTDAEVLKLREDVERLREERRELRMRLVQCRYWAGRTPFCPEEIGNVALIREATDATLNKVTE